MVQNCYWQQSAIQPNGKKPASESYDVIVLGGGFAGLSAARFIRKRDASAKVLVLERDYVGFGASGRNGGFAMTLLGMNNAQLYRDHGADRGGAGHRFMKDSVNHVRSLISDYQIECEAVDQGLMTVALNNVMDKRILHEVECYKKLGTEVRYLDQNEIRKVLPNSEVVSSGLWDPNCVVLHPFKLARGLKKVAEDLGAEICEGTGAAGFSRTAHGYEVRLDSGERLQCKKLIVTTNAYAGELGMFRSGLLPVYTYIVTTEPLSQAQWDQIGWSTRHGIETAFRLVHYMRPTQDGRILLGGKSAYYYFGHGTRPEYDQHPRLFEALRADVAKLFPALKGIGFSHAWGGPVGATLSFYPSVGHDAKDPNLLWALGCCGHGVASTCYFGSILTSLIYNDRSPDTELFFVNKKPWALLPPEPLKYIGAGAYKNTMWFWDRIDEIRSGRFF